MKKITPEEIKNAFDAMPSNLVNAISSIKVEKVIQEIEKKYSLHIDKAGTLNGLRPLVFAGLLSTQEFSQEIEQGMGLSVIQTPLLISDLNEKIFAPVRQKMQEIEELNRPIEDEQVADTLPQETIPKEIISVDLDSPTQEKNTTNILKDAKIELIKPRETAISDALDTTDAQALTRDALIKSLENPTRNDTSMPHPQIQKPANVGIASAIQTAKIIPPVVKLQDMPVPQQFVGMPKNQPESTAPSTPTPTPVPAPQGNVVAQKLQTTFKIPKQESNYTLPQVTGSADKQKDLYREAI